MSKRVKALGATTFLLFVISITTFYLENHRQTDILIGSYFLTGFDIDKISKFTIHGKDQKTLVFQRQGSGFTLSNYHHYPADNEKINDILFKISNLKIKEKEDLSEKKNSDYQLAENGYSSKLEFHGNQGQLFLTFFIGKYKNKVGSYIRKLGDENIFVASENIYINPDKNQYINTQLVQLIKEDINQVDVSSKQLVIVKRNDKKEFEIEGIDQAKVQGNKVTSFISDILKPQIQNFYPLGDTALNKVRFDKSFKVALNNNLIYSFRLGEESDKYFLQAQASVDEVRSQFVIGKDDDKEKLQNVEKVMKSQGIAQSFNIRHGKWVYEITKNQYHNLTRDRTFFLNQEKK
ncbi:MAG: DUF4340 domain-containing protein [Bacteriovoracaceae bacterium]|jgi:hypothetical protein|nr:DUF4340 domain-containing protein [Bacteriovoracaceae bacterium]